MIAIQKKDVAPRGLELKKVQLAACAEAPAMKGLAHKTSDAAALFAALCLCKGKAAALAMTPPEVKAYVREAYADAPTRLQRDICFSLVRSIKETRGQAQAAASKRGQAIAGDYGLGISGGSGRRHTLAAQEASCPAVVVRHGNRVRINGNLA